MDRLSGCEILLVCAGGVDIPCTSLHDACSEYVYRCADQVHIVCTSHAPHVLYYSDPFSGSFRFRFDTEEVEKDSCVLKQAVLSVYLEPLVLSDLREVFFRRVFSTVPSGHSRRT